MRVKGDALKQLHRHDAAIEIEALQEELNKRIEDLYLALECENNDNIDWCREEISILTNDIEGLKSGSYRAHVEPHNEADRWDRKEDSIIHWQREQEAVMKRVRRKLA